LKAEHTPFTLDPTKAEQHMGRLAGQSPAFWHRGEMPGPVQALADSQAVRASSPVFGGVPMRAQQTLPPEQSLRLSQA
jgi:hypothetical protein